MSSHRRIQVGEMLLGFLGEELGRLNDPRLKGVTLTGVDMSPDLKTAKVFWAAHTLNRFDRAGTTDLGESKDFLVYPNSEREAAQAGLDSAARELKRRVAAELKLRNVPALTFIYDDSLEKGARIDYLLHKAGL